MAIFWVELRGVKFKYLPIHKLASELAIECIRNDSKVLFIEGCEEDITFRMTEINKKHIFGTLCLLAKLCATSISIIHGSSDLFAH